MFLHFRMNYVNGRLDSEKGKNLDFRNVQRSHTLAAFESSN